MSSYLNLKIYLRPRPEICLNKFGFILCTCLHSSRDDGKN